MRFAQEYKYRNIPFCSQCAAHTKFIPVQSNRVVGAVTYDNPNSNIDPTFVATRTETKLVCSTCGSEMFKWADKSSAIGKYFDQFWSENERLKKQCIGCSGCALNVLMLVGVILMLGLPTGLIVERKELKFCILSIYLCSVFFTSKWMNNENKVKVLKVGKGVNGETVLFDQATGNIEYK